MYRKSAAIMSNDSKECGNMATESTLKSTKIPANAHVFFCRLAICLKQSPHPSHIVSPNQIKFVTKCNNTLLYMYQLLSFVTLESPPSSFSLVYSLCSLFLVSGSP